MKKPSLSLSKRAPFLPNLKAIALAIVAQLKQYLVDWTPFLCAYSLTTFIAYGLSQPYVAIPISLGFVFAQNALGLRHGLKKDAK